jgi:hypothetical protein
MALLCDRILLSAPWLERTCFVVSEVPSATLTWWPCCRRTIAPFRVCSWIYGSVVFFVGLIALRIRHNCLMILCFWDTVAEYVTLIKYPPPAWSFSNSTLAKHAPLQHAILSTRPSHESSSICAHLLSTFRETPVLLSLLLSRFVSSVIWHYAIWFRKFLPNYTALHPMWL